LANVRVSVDIEIDGEPVRGTPFVYESGQTNVALTIHKIIPPGGTAGSSIADQLTIVHPTIHFLDFLLSSSSTTPARINQGGAVIFANVAGFFSPGLIFTDTTTTGQYVSLSAGNGA
jgi:hypothetical protein